MGYTICVQILLTHIFYYIRFNFKWDGWDGIFGYLTSHEAYCLCVGNHSGHNLHTRGWDDMKVKGQPNWDSNPEPPSQWRNHATNWANEAGPLSAVKGPSTQCSEGSEHYVITGQNSIWCVMPGHLWTFQFILWYLAWCNGQSMTSRLIRAANQSLKTVCDIMLGHPGKKCIIHDTYFLNG